MSSDHVEKDASKFIPKAAAKDSGEGRAAKLVRTWDMPHNTDSTLIPKPGSEPMKRGLSSKSPDDPPAAEPETKEAEPWNQEEPLPRTDTHEIVPPSKSTTLVPMPSMGGSGKKRSRSKSRSKPRNRSKSGSSRRRK